MENIYLSKILSRLFFFFTQVQNECTLHTSGGRWDSCVLFSTFYLCIVIRQVLSKRRENHFSNHLLCSGTDSTFPVNWCDATQCPGICPSLLNLFPNHLLRLKQFTPNLHCDPILSERLETPQPSHRHLKATFFFDP